MRPLDAWVTGFVAVGAVATAVLVYMASGAKWQVGTIGEWVSGLGSLGAVIVAVIVSARQSRLAQQQFKDEREHAAFLVEEERRYQARLSEMAAQQQREAEAVRDYKNAAHAVRIVTNAFVVARNVINGLQKSPKGYAARARIVVNSRSFQAADAAMAAINAGTFKNESIAEAIYSLGIMWSRVRTVFDVLADRDRQWSEESVQKVELDAGINETVLGCMTEVLLHAPGATRSRDEAAAAAAEWVAKALPIESV